MNNTLTVKIERAISELRRGGKLVISDINSGTSVLLVASELIQNHTINELSKLALSRPSIILSKNRSIAIGINAGNGPCSILIKNNWKIDFQKRKHLNPMDHVPCSELQNFHL